MTIRLSAGGSGSDGEGSGLANVFRATATVDRSSLANNQANGDGGGVGLGSDVFNDATSTLTLAHASVTKNQASVATGIAGGIYTLGTISTDSFTVIEDDHASIISDTIGP
jgi:hypothetical protein